MFSKPLEGEKNIHSKRMVSGYRAFVQEPQKGIDPRCPRANGFFDHEDPAVCNKFYREDTIQFCRELDSCHLYFMTSGQF